MAQPNIKVNTGNNTQMIVYGIVGLAVLGVAYFGIIKPILNNLGITKDAQDRQADKNKEEISKQQVLSTLLYNSNKSKVTISSAKANTSATQIWDAKYGGCCFLGICTCDAEDKAVGAITSAGSLVNISYIASVFQSMYGRDLYGYLESFLQSSHWNTINDYLIKTKKF